MMSKPCLLIAVELLQPNPLDLKLQEQRSGLLMSRATRREPAHTQTARRLEFHIAQIHLAPKR